jgi:hypothetical protein
MKALEKDRARRYDTATIALDVQRHLDDEPVMARPRAPAIVFGKLVRHATRVPSSAALPLFGIGDWHHRHVLGAAAGDACRRRGATNIAIAKAVNAFSQR